MCRLQNAYAAVKAPPTINKMLDSINTMLDATATIQEKPLTRKEILDSIERGEMSVKDAAFILKTQK